MEKLWSALALALMLLMAGAAHADTAADAGTAVDRWAAAFNANDVDTLVEIYAVDATLMGTSDAAVKQGRDAIRRYYSRLNRSGDQVSLGERKIIALSDDIVYVTGDYEFSASPWCSCGTVATG
jgi:ketosteroid isomerase-like protein